MSLSTFPSRCADRTGIRWRASADIFSKVQGSRYIVFRGRMFSSLPNTYSDNKKGVVKMQMSKTVSLSNWTYYLKCSREANNYAISFTEYVPPESQMLKISFVASCVAAVDKVSFPALANRLLRNSKRRPEKNEYVLIEEMISGHLKVFDTLNHKVLGCDFEYLQAFSHYTYWKSNREHIVCDMKGVHNRNRFLFTCPSIHSVNREFGPDDLGEAGIRRFFANHQCGKICRPWADCQWSRASPPPYPTSETLTPGEIHQRDEPIIPQAPPPSHCASAVDVFISTLASSPSHGASAVDVSISTLSINEVARPCESPVSESVMATLEHNMATLRVPPVEQRRRTMSDQTDLPPPYSLVAELGHDPRLTRPNSSMTVSDLQAEHRRNRHWSDSDCILTSRRGNRWNDVLPTYDAVAAALASRGTRPFDFRQSVGFAVGERISRRRTSEEPYADHSAADDHTVANEQPAIIV